MISSYETETPSARGMFVARSVAEFRQWRRQAGQNAAGGEDKAVLGFVPTMGALHEGHLTLIRNARARCRAVVVSIFVNPLQFGPSEDFSKYPRPLERDLELCRQEGVDGVFVPAVEEMYGKSERSGGSGTSGESGDSGTSESCFYVEPPAALTERLCGAFRPGHFRGVATVVSKLFNIVVPDVAFFGEKDYQQLVIIRRLVADLDFDLLVEGVPTVREADGLAMSSRNAYLSEGDRLKASEIHRTLSSLARSIEEGSNGEPALAPLLESGRKRLEQAGFEVQYLDACHPQTLARLTTGGGEMILLVAARLGAVRLIDNLRVRPRSRS